MFRTKPKTAPKGMKTRQRYGPSSQEKLEEIQIYSGKAFNPSTFKMPSVRASEIYKDADQYKRPFTGATSGKNDIITQDKTEAAITERDRTISPKSSLVQGKKIC
jgi:hypothetical protein